jgi:hypothetical protein
MTVCNKLPHISIHYMYQSCSRICIKYLNWIGFIQRKSTFRVFFGSHQQTEDLILWALNFPCWKHVMNCIQTGPDLVGFMVPLVFNWSWTKSANQFDIYDHTVFKCLYRVGHINMYASVCNRTSSCISNLTVLTNPLTRSVLLWQYFVIRSRGEE